MPQCACRFAALLALSVCWAAATCRAQEIEPRAYAPSPVGVNLLLGVAAYSEGGVLTDPSLPVTDIEAKISALGWGYVRTFSLAGRSANVGFAVPYVQLDASGNIGEEQRTASREGVGDTKLRLAVNLLGGPAMTPREFAQREPKTTLGFGLMVNVPTGEYDPTKLVNIGTNRWAAKTELGLSHPMGKWLLETYAGTWWFGDNDNYFGGQLREQDPLTSFQAHLSYNFNPRLWVALNTTYYQGGQTTLNGVDRHDRQANSRAGVTVSMPVGKEYTLKFSVSRGATTRIGSNFTNFGLSFSYAWLDKPRP